MDFREKIEAHFEKLKGLVELEEQEEILKFQREFQNKTPEERELAGKALLSLNVVETHFSAAGHRLVTFKFADERKLPVFSLDTGDVVSLSEDRADLYSARFPIGTVYDKTADEITVAFNRELPDWVHSEGLYQLNRAGNRSTYKKIYEALETAREAEHGRLAALRNIFLGLKPAADGDPLKPETFSFLNPSLNPSQKEAVLKSLEAQDVAIVHGPPGTGKTTVLVEIIRHAVNAGQFVYAAAPSNTACDHLLQCLVASGIRAVRLGHPARIMEHLREHTLDFKLGSHPHAKLVDELQSEIERIYRRKDRHRERRELPYDERRELTEQAKLYKSEVRKLEAEIYGQVVREAQVMVGTHASASDFIFEQRPIDLLIMDEASQATEPSAWVAVLRAKKVILAGDHLQLPPTVKSIEAEKKGLGITLFERLYEILDGKFKTLLKYQYRMNEKIMNFSSYELYGGELIADASVADQVLAGLPHVKRVPETEEPVVYIDTAGQGFEECLEPGSESRFNAEEAGLALKELQKLLDAGVKPEEIAIISPYSAQVRLLTSKLPHPEIEVDSVDGFQGREKEAVILSLVRSNVEGEMGFLVDVRRMNVAITRAKRKLIVIGDSATLSTIPFYLHFIQYAEGIHAYRSSWELS